jgi:hypothetical protein
MPRKKRKPVPPCPDAELFTLVELEDRYIWKRRRGSLSPALLNASLSKNASLTTITNAASRRIFTRLEPFLRGLAKGYAQACVSGRLKKSMNARGQMDFHFLEGFDFQQKHPLEQLLLQPLSVGISKGEVVLTVPIGKHAVKRNSQLVSGYYFEAILLYGDVSKERGLHIESVESKLYDFNEKGNCVLRLELPVRKVPWMVLLKVSCMEGNELAVHPRHYGLKVVKVYV